MPISNYTTTIAPEKTIGEISKMLARFGARRIITDYDDDGELTALQFMLEIKGKMAFYQLPCNAQGVLNTLVRDQAPAKFRNLSHARRVAWRIIRDWVEAQIAIVDAGQAVMAEVFLPYAVAQSGKTLYQEIEAGRIKLLGEKPT